MWLTGQGAPGVLLSPALSTPSPRTTDASKQAHCLMWLPENSNSRSCLWNTKRFTYWAVSATQVYVLNTYLCPRGSASRTLINDTQLMDSFSQWPKAWCRLFLQKYKTSWAEGMHPLYFYVPLHALRLKSKPQLENVGLRSYFLTSGWFNIKYLCVVVSGMGLSV